MEGTMLAPSLDLLALAISKCLAFPASLKIPYPEVLFHSTLACMVTGAEQTLDPMKTL